LIFLGTASSRLGAAMCDRLGSRPSAAEVLRFSEDGVFVRFEPARAYDLIQLLESVARLDDPDQIPSCRKLVDYVYANREGIKNYRLIPLASSGPMEKAIDILASRRLKSRAMSWRRPGAHHTVRLRLLSAWAVGHILAIDPPQHISWTWDWEAEPLGATTVVAFDLIDHGKRTHLTLRHVGFRSRAQLELHDALWRYWFGRLVEAAVPVGHM